MEEIKLLLENFEEVQISHCCSEANHMANWGAKMAQPRCSDIHSLPEAAKEHIRLEKMEIPNSKIRQVKVLFA